jgi:acyl-coenzyme A thioesterase PaaI-like protein
MGLELLSIDPEHDALTMRMGMRSEYERMHGSAQWHGGPIAALADTIGD